MTTLAQQFARSLTALRNCEDVTRPAPGMGRDEAIALHGGRLAECMARMPSGSGVDDGCELDDSSTPNRLVFLTSFHHMDEHGGYDGWTSHKVIVTPDLAFGFDVRVTGPNRNDIRDYLGELFHAALSETVDI